ncbi:hypothetical protein Nmel_018126 [Mimus melanotis]
MPARPRAWRGSRAPSPAGRALSPGSLFVCQHITCRRWMTLERRIFFKCCCCGFFLTKSKYFCPHGDGSGSLSMERHTGVPAGEGTPGSVRRLRCWRLHPWRGPQCLYIDMFVRGTGPFLAPKQLEESQKVKKFSIARGREGARSDCARGRAMPTATDPKCGVRPKKTKALVLIK